MLNEGALYSSEKSMSIIATSAFYQFCAGSFQNHVGEIERQIWQSTEDQAGFCEGPPNHCMISTHVHVLPKLQCLDAYLKHRCPHWDIIRTDMRCSGCKAFSCQRSLQVNVFDDRRIVVFYFQPSWPRLRLRNQSASTGPWLFSRTNLAFQIGGPCQEPLGVFSSFSQAEPCLNCLHTYVLTYVLTYAPA